MEGKSKEERERRCERDGERKTQDLCKTFGCKEQVEKRKSGGPKSER